MGLLTLMRMGGGEMVRFIWEMGDKIIKHIQHYFSRPIFNYPSSMVFPLFNRMSQREGKSRTSSVLCSKWRARRNDLLPRPPPAPPLHGRQSLALEDRRTDQMCWRIGGGRGGGAPRSSSLGLIMYFRCLRIRPGDDTWHQLPPLCHRHSLLERVRIHPVRYFFHTDIAPLSNQEVLHRVRKQLIKSGN